MPASIDLATKIFEQLERTPQTVASIALAIAKTMLEEKWAAEEAIRRQKDQAQYPNLYPGDESGGSGGKVM